MTINSRTKGRAGEQEIARILRDTLNLEITRNWAEQAHHGGADILGVPGWCIEVKRAKRYLGDWWRQTEEQADSILAKPALLYRLDRKQWVAEVRGKDVISELEDEDFRVSMPLHAWITIVRERM